ncbi:NifB/NifX family molybdenum-iron cluster-binding protein [Desulfuromonas thiophila]|uniref:NifB/NifX family molybdenum-iron cluster-binding protein n=2 Tax=Desulfuromonas thiophila TaxID=57664 RepID=UPI0029F4F79D|nr:NifB/NifX family molybdenum-iron cluster-binding protein [Desulfuromonas thiophila]
METAFRPPCQLQLQQLAPRRRRLPQANLLKSGRFIFQQLWHHLCKLLCPMNPATPLRIAIPCNADRVHPRFDQAHCFCFGEIDAEGGCQIGPEQCCPHGEDVCRWLATQGVQGVLCSGIQQHYQVRLRHQGIWSRWGASGPIQQALQDWLAEGLPRCSGQLHRQRQ